MASRSIKMTCLVLFTFVILTSSLITAEARYLQSNTSLYISANKSHSTWFKAGSNVNERSPGVASAGTLLNNTSLYISTNHSHSTWFQAGTGASFNPDGSVAAGTLLNNTSLYISTTIPIRLGFARGARSQPGRMAVLAEGLC